MKGKTVKRLPSIELIRLVLAGDENGWRKYYFLYDGLYRKILKDEFKKSSVILTQNEVDILMAELWESIPDAINTFVKQDEDDFVIRDIESSFL